MKKWRGQKTIKRHTTPGIRWPSPTQPLAWPPRLAACQCLWWSDVLGLNVYAHLVRPGGAVDVRVVSENGRTRDWKPVDEQHEIAEVGRRRG